MANPFNLLAAEHEFDAETESQSANAVTMNEIFAPLTDDEKASSLADDLHSGASPEALAIVPEDAPPVVTLHPKFGEAKTVYVYRDVMGNLRFCAVRFEWEQDGELKKAVLPATWCGLADKLAWRFKGPKGPRTLYNADEIAQNPEAVVLFVEGEKTADAVPVLFPDMVGATTLGGCGSPHLSDFSPLQGRTVVVSPDNDEPGRKYAENVARLAMAAGAKEVKFLRPERLGGENAKRGWDLADAVAEGWTAEKVAVEFAKGDLFEAFPLASNDNRQIVPTARRTFEHPYRLTQDGVELVRRDDEGHEVCQLVCTPVRIVGQARDGSGRGWSLVIEVQDPDGTWHELVLPKTQLAGDGKAVLEVLMDHGLDLSPLKGARKAALDYLATAQPSHRILFADKTGWLSGRKSLFVLPNLVYGEAEGERVLFRSEGRQIEITLNGLMGDWLRVSALAVGNSRFTLALSVAFLGPLLSLVGAEGGGFHLVGPSSIGKSTLLILISAAWGIAIASWRTTDNALEANAAAHNHLVMLLDEVGEVSAKVVGPIAYMLANGKGKGRAGQTGDARAIRSWLMTFLSTGEVGIADKMHEAGSRVMAGQEVRVIDIRADVGAGFGIYESVHGMDGGRELSDHIKAICQKVRGVAGDAFLKCLSVDPEGAATAVKAAAEDFVRDHCPQGADGQVHRVAWRFGLAAAAGELAVAYGVLDWPAGEAVRGVAVCFRDWLANRGGIGSSEVREALRQILGFIEMHGSSRFDEWTDKALSTAEITVDKARDRVGWRRKGQDGNWEYFATAHGFAEMCRGTDQKLTVKALVEACILKPGADGKTAKAVSVPGHGKMRLYHIVPPAVEGDTDA